MSAVESAARLPGELPFLAEVVSDLRDDAPKLVYADWLEDHGDPRGPFLREFVAAAKAGGRLPSSKPFPRPWRDLVGVTLAQGVAQFGLEDRLDALRGLARPAFGINRARSSDRRFAVGATKFGGLPDLPPDLDWPTWRKGPLGFLAQFRLADLAGTVAGRDLPPDGLLSFFVFNDDVEGMPGPGEGSWRVVHTPEGRPLRRCAAPDDDLGDWNQVAPACSLRITEALDVPDSGDDSPWGAAVGVGERWEPYHGLRLHLVGFRHRMLGYARPMTISDPTRDAGWQHLITFGSDEELGWGWGDGDNLYYLIRKDDLAAKRFDGVRLTHG